MQKHLELQKTENNTHQSQMAEITRIKGKDIYRDKINVYRVDNEYK